MKKNGSSQICFYDPGKQVFHITKKTALRVLLCAGA